MMFFPFGWLFFAPGISALISFESDILEIPSEWNSLGRADPLDTIKFTLAVKQTNLDKLENLLLRVSDPLSPIYGHHLTREEVDLLVSPTLKSKSAVKHWLAQDWGIVDYDHTTNSDFIRFVASVQTAERVLNTKYYSFIHSLTKQKTIRAREYSLPNSIAAHLDFVSPTVRFPSIREPIFQDNLGATPSSLRKLYSVGDVEGKSKDNRQAVTAFLKQYYLPSDLQTFFEKLYPIAKGRTIEKVIGPNKGRAGVEAALDVEYITALGGNIPTQFWSFPGTAPDNPENEPFLDWMYLVANTTDDKVPYVFSTSYGEAESSVSMDYSSRINVEFQKAGVRGISILFASGDYGVGSGRCTKFVPVWPSASPWVTAVGGTTSASGGEKCASLSSGGFSNRWAQPSYQTTAVDTFFKTATDLPDSSRYNKTGRAFPDVAAMATGFEVICNGQTYSGVAGTSCSSPTFSGVVGLLNDLRLQQGKSKLGFLNPFLYQNPQALNDIVSGNNPGCGTQGFHSIKGWDPCTGYGTPNYELLAKAVNNLA